MLGKTIGKKIIQKLWHKKSKVKKVIKRDGSVKDFNPEKVYTAVLKAFSVTREGKESDAWLVADEVMDSLNKNFNGGSGRIPHVEEIQNFVESALMSLGYKKTAKAYILYREQHRGIRETKKVLEGAIDLVDQYLESIDWRVNENANMAYSLQGLNNYISSAVSQTYWLNKIYPKAIQDAHLSGAFHIHDLQIIAAYCCGWDLQDLIRTGFTGVGGKVSCKPPKHMRSLLGQMVNFIYTLQGEVAGAQAFSNFDTMLAPFVRYDKLNYDDVKQNIQSFVYNMNVSTRVGFQTPFSNITLDLICPKTLVNEPVIIGGIPQKELYGEFQEEINLINRAFAEVMSEGDAHGRVFTFPIPTYNIDKNFDWDNEKYNPIWEMTAKYGIPYFANFVNSDLNPEDARSMCCRLRLDNRELYKRGGGLFGANPLTGSVGVVTINLPRLGYLSKSKKDFYKNLDNLMDIAKQSLETKREIIEKFTDKGLYPYAKFYLRDIKERRGTYWSNHFATIGLVGMNECLLNLLGKDITDASAHEFAKEALAYMRERLVKYQEETGNLYNLEATPAEGTAYRLARLDKKAYPEIIVANNVQVKEKKADPYYTNSTHLPVNYTNDIFEALDLQDDLQTQYTGGTVLHGFIGERLHDINSVKTLLKKVYSKYRLPYITFTPTFSICPAHGYIAGEHFFCPSCTIADNKQQKLFTTATKTLITKQ
ncbi:MAG: Ribonucleoside-triphosphate reductase class III catalytic subunit [Parcubacteria group bacterium GW2011_GWA2_38_13]|nr:MAG: Ribonucleoside-triphosphate reductase class III catalytic subunit [Parcubacteria group bacterium GW2011_GWA2_38_13]